MDTNKIKKYADMEFDKYKIAKAVTEVQNEIKNQEGGRDLAMSDYFKTLREPLIAQQKKKTDEKQDELIERLKDNQDRILQAIEYNPQRALTYEGQTLPKLDWEGKKRSEYAFIDTDDEEEEEIDTDDEDDKEDKDDDWEESSDDEEKPSTTKNQITWCSQS